MRHLVTVVLGALLFSTLALAPAFADEEEVDAFEALTSFELDVDPNDYITRLTGDRHITTLSDEGYVDQAEQIREDRGETTISLSADILFNSHEWQISDSAANRIEELVAEVPTDAGVVVTGHTDSRPTADHVDFDNQELSENRAEAVANVIEQARPDLALETSGVAADQPAVQEDEDDPETFAQNRRVELVYDSPDD